jgi:hypothetical protein
MIIRARRLQRFRRTFDALSKSRRIINRKRYAEPYEAQIPFQYFMPLYWTRCVNLPTQTISSACKIMQATAYQNVRCRRPVYSVSFYFRRHDAINHDSLIKIVNGLVAELGLTQHQSVYCGVMQQDTLAIHAVINRIHPETCRSAELKHDHYTISKYAQEAEKRYCLEREERRHFNNGLRKRGVSVKARRPLHDYITDIAWTEKKIEEALERCATAERWTNFVRHLEDYGLLIEVSRGGTFVARNRLNSREFKIEKESDLHAKVDRLFEYWARWLSELLPLTEERQRWDPFLREHFKI